MGPGGGHGFLEDRGRGEDGDAFDVAEGSDGVDAMSAQGGEELDC